MNDDLFGAEIAEHADLHQATAVALASKKRNKSRQAARAGTFTDNMKLPVHGWFRYSAGFSAEWVREVIRADLPSGGCVLDPFGGSGTTLIAADAQGVKSFGFESHPFVQRIAQAKTSWNASPDLVLELGEKIASHVSSRAKATAMCSDAPELLTKCFTPETLAALYQLRDGWEHEVSLRSIENTPECRLIWLAISSILRACSGVGTAQWQYVLPNKKKAKVALPRDAFLAKVAEIAADMRAARSEGWIKSSTIFNHDARKPAIPIPDHSVDLVITSPPYANNYDYADATRLEMTFWGEIRGWGDLTSAVRGSIIRSCTQHAAADRVDLHETLKMPGLDAIREEMGDVCAQLSDVRQEKGGKKNYHTMVAAYFADMAATFVGLRRACKPGARMIFVVGDSAPYGVYVPVDQWLGRIAVQAGFHAFSFSKIRDRNTKWKNRKHTVPLHEGYLIIEG